MSVATPICLTSDERAAVPPEMIWRLSLDQFHQMVQKGILTENDPVELLDGWLVYKMPTNPQHATSTELTREAIERNLPEGWFVNVQQPITTAASEPEPDVTLVRGVRRDFLRRHPGPGDIALVVEVADATLDRDREFKRLLYAYSGIPIYWIVNLPDSRIEVFTRPTGPVTQPDYGYRREYHITDHVPLEVDGRQIASIPVQEMLP